MEKSKKSTLSIGVETKERLKTVRRQMNYSLDADLTMDDVVIKLCGLWENGQKAEVTAEEAAFKGLGGGEATQSVLPTDGGGVEETAPEPDPEPEPETETPKRGKKSKGV